MVSESSAISFASTFFSDVSSSCVAAMDSMLACALSRALVALPISVSQKPFWVASALACSSSLSMMSLMSPRTLTKWSCSTMTFTAAALRTWLFSFRAAAVSMEVIFLSCSDFDRAECSWICRKDGASLKDTLPLGSCTKPVSFSLASYWADAPDCRASTALPRAVSSPERDCERWSQSLDFSSHSWVTSLRKPWSEARSFCS
mmetsp:Transcript_53604/g.157821  ORF Transcript_53604/g.157821 Transcript_53604/m.157821 type:complete len:203 (+) Transcript_53604:306-914(+)